MRWADSNRSARCIAGPVHALAEQALKDGDYKIGHLFSRAPTRYISEGEIRDSRLFAGNLPECEHRGGI